MEAIMAQDYVDPFEAYKRKQEEAEELKKAAEAAAKLAGAKSVDGRPKGFESHRYDFADPKAVRLGSSLAGSTVPPPKGFEPRAPRMDGGKVEPAPKPKGFSTHRITQ
jgi:hypothetical protein